MLAQGSPLAVRGSWPSNKACSREYPARLTGSFKPLDSTALQPATGRELWRWGTWNPKRIGHWRLVPSPVAGKGVILACAPKREPVYAVRADGVRGRTERRAAARIGPQLLQALADPLDRPSGGRLPNLIAVVTARTARMAAMASSGSCWWPSRRRRSCSRMRRAFRWL